MFLKVCCRSKKKTGLKGRLFLFLFCTLCQGWGRSGELFSFMFTFLISKVEDLRINLYL